MPELVSLPGDSPIAVVSVFQLLSLFELSLSLSRFRLALLPTVNSAVAVVPAVIPAAGVPVDQNFHFRF